MSIRPIFKLLFAFTFIVLVNSIASAQSYFADDDIRAIENKAIHLFEQEKYAAAQEQYERLLAIDKDIQHEDWKELKTKASYYKAICSYHLKSNSLVGELIQFIADHNDHTLGQQARLHLGKYFFNKRKHKSAINTLIPISTKQFTPEEFIETQFMLGYAHFFKKKFVLAKGYFEKIKDQPSDYYFSANYYLGYMAYYDKDYDKALSHFFIAQNSKMYGNLVPYYIAQIYFIKEDFQKVIDYAEPLLGNEELQYFASTQNIVGQSYFKIKDYEKALPYQMQFVAESKKVQSSDVYNLAFCHYKLKQYTEAIDQLVKLTDSKDSLAQNSNYLLGDCFLAIGDKHSARSAFKNAYLLDFNQQIKEESSFNYAKLTYDLQFHNEAIASVQEFIAEYPQSEYLLKANELLTTLFLETRDYESAFEAIEKMHTKSAAIRKAYQKVAFYRGVELYQDQLIPEAISFFDIALKNPFDKTINTKALFWKGEAFFLGKDYKQANEYYNQFLSSYNNGDDLNPIESKAFAYYNIGYCYYNRDMFQKAVTYFERAIESFEKEDSTVQLLPAYKKSNPDAYLRNADCQFLLKNYKKAIKRYQIIIDKNYRGKDYALYQQGVIYGLDKPANNEMKIKNLEFLISNYQWSIYFDDAHYELGNTYYEEQNMDSAIYFYEKVEEQFPGSYFGRKSLLKLALIHFNSEQNDLAEEKCKALLSNYSNTQEAREAINILKEIYISRGDASNFFALLRNEFPDVQISINEQDSISYFAAETQYINDHFEAASELFDNYLTEFENGFFRLNAHFYRGQCLFRNKDFEKALEDYVYVLENTNNKFTETSLYNAAYIYDHVLNDADNAFTYYEHLLKTSEFQSSKLTALVGLVKNAYLLMKLPETISYAKLLMAHEKANPDHLLQANLYLAKAQYDQQQLDSSLVAFNEVALETQNEWGVESRYFIAEIHNQKELYDTSLTLCFDIINNLPNYEFWTAKTFILLADNYHHLDNNFQAKATLQSIIDYYEGNELKAIAEENLAAIIKAEKDTLQEIVDSVIIDNDSILVAEDTASVKIETTVQPDKVDDIQMEFDTILIGNDTIYVERDMPTKTEVIDTPSDSVETSPVIMDTVPATDTLKSEPIIKESSPAIDSVETPPIIQDSIPEGIINTIEPMDTMIKDSIVAPVDSINSPLNDNNNE